VLAQFAQDPDQKTKLARLSSDDPDLQTEYENYIVKDNRTICEVLKEFDSVKVPIDNFLEHLPKLQPRFYSISASPNEHKDTVHITAVVSNWVTPTGRKANGVATTWLSKVNLDSPVFVPAFIRKSNFFPPKAITTPMIMVGPGTGLAPFRGFLQERKYRLSLPENKDIKKADAILFFGCRTNVDYLYQEELEAYAKEGVLSDLKVAFSRLQKEKLYVQHLMTMGDVPEKIWDSIKRGGHFYVCGDAKLMARDVGDTLIKIASEQGAMSKADAEKYVEKMMSDSRYQSDVWS